MTAEEQREDLLLVVAGATVAGISRMRPAQARRARATPTGRASFASTTGDVDVIASTADLRGATRTTVRPGDEVLSLALELR